MAIENIKQMTRPLSEGKKVASHDAPEDYLKRAVEQFIIEFPEFEELDREELYKEMDKKGWFSDQYAMSDPHPDSERFDMMDIMDVLYLNKHLYYIHLRKIDHIFYLIDNNYHLYQVDNFHLFF